MNGSLCRVWDAGKASQDNRRRGGHTGQVAMAGQPLLQQPSHLWRLHHHQPLGRYSRPLCSQVSPLTFSSPKFRGDSHHLKSFLLAALTLSGELLSFACLPFLCSNLSYRLPQVSSWVVYAGIVTRSSSKMAQHMGYAVEKIIYNKNYNHRSHDSDIALMKLRTPLNFSGQFERMNNMYWLFHFKALQVI